MLSFHTFIALVHLLHGNPYSLTLISIQLVAIENLNVTPATLLDFSATAQNLIGFPIRVGRFVFYVGR